MTRIPNDQLERLKQEVSLLRLVESQGYQPKKHGTKGDYAICCPFREEKTPSCVISADKNLFHCFGCGAAGTVIDWVMRTQKLSFRHAVEVLQADHFLAAKDNPAPVRPLALLFKPDNDNQAVLQNVIQFYHETLKQSPEALAYLEKRGLGDRELIDRFKLGYANRTLGYRLPPKRTKAGDALRGQLTEVGLYRESGHEHFNGSLVVPVFDNDGNVVEAYGRKIRNDLRKGTPKHLYLPGEHCGVWNIGGLKTANKEQNTVILCESLIDAMTFWVHGYRHVTASYGTQGFTSDHLAAFKRHGIERVLIAYDRDEAGNSAAEKLAKQLQQHGFDCYRLHFPKGMDANQYALEVTPASKSLGIVIRSAEWMGQGKAPERQLDIAIPLAKALEQNENMPPPLAAEVVDPETLPPVQAQPEPTKNDIEAKATEKEISFTFGDRKYRIRGLEKNKNYEVMKVNVLVSCDESLHVDTFDLYSAKHRQGFIRVAALELETEESTLKKDLGKVLLKLEELQEKLINGPVETEKQAALSEDEKAQALELLRDPGLLDRILNDFTHCGVVGEETNTLVGYLAASSRKLDKPLAIVIQSTSAAGKSSLMDAVLAMMPEDERVHYSAMTGQSLFYMGETNLKHKILAIAEEEGAENASYALKLLQSDGEITIASTGKDESTGDMVTKEYHVEGPVMLFFTTTAIDIDEELLNRCTLLTVNESREQTRAIHEAQRKRRTLAGLQAKLEKETLIKLHRNAQKLLRPLAVINPYADQLTFLDDKTRTRRDHEKYLTLIDTIAFIHQYQREILTTQYADKEVSYIEVELTDIETANKLAHEVLGRTLDELPAQTRKLLKRIQTMVQDECKKQSLEQKDYRFSRREIRGFTGWSDNQLKVHCARLTELEYLLIHSGHRGKVLQYELLYDNANGEDDPHLMGLIDSSTIKKNRYDSNKLGLNTNKLEAGPSKLVPSCPQVGAKLELEKSLQPNSSKALNKTSWESQKKGLPAKKNGEAVVTVGAV